MTGFLSRLAFLQQTEKIVWLLKVLVEDTSGGDSQIKGTGMLVGKLELSP